LWHEVKANGRTFEVIARPMENGHEPEDWVLVMSDVTQEREVREQLERQERLAAVGQLATGIAHDFSNVMATIVLYAQMTAQAEGLSDRDRERMATINQQARHATRLIQQILDFSRRAVLAQQPLDLLVLLEEVAKLLERTLPEHIRIDLAYGPDEYIVRADPTRMRQMVTNLALNARDAMPLGGALRIGLEAIEVRPGESPLLPEMEAGNWIRLTVSDTGTGIPPDVLPHIFEPFFTTKEPSIGTGLGLAQVHGIVGQHEGRIEVETQVGEGTTFTIYLPALPGAPIVSPVPELSALPQGRGETVLVVEDETSVRRALVESLEQLNYRVLEAENGQDALEILEQHEVALVVSDVVMPKMGGVALFHAMKQRGSTVPMVLLTGHPMEEELEDLKAEGLDAWLLKPPDLEQLAEVVARALETE
jgi:signal transduction histidine kinase